MKQSYLIQKASGDMVPFDVEKYRRSLQKSGAHSDIIHQIVKRIEQIKPKTTQELHVATISLLEELKPAVAGRYNLKRAIMALGPAGYSFESFIGEIFKHQGYEVQIHITLRGKCIEQEIDVIAQKDNKRYMIECKFHNKPGLASAAKIAMYTKARFDDIHISTKENKANRLHFDQAWLITNTRFTSQAILYAQCEHIRVTSWAHPEGESLAGIIDSLGLHPITSLPGLSKTIAKQLISQGRFMPRCAKI